MSFQEACKFACAVLPGLQRDLKTLAAYRKSQPRDMEGIGRIAVSIPDPILTLMKNYFPELFQEDQQLADAAMLKWMHTDDAKIFRVGIKL